MRWIRQNAKPVCVFSTFLVLLISVPLDSVLAAMVGTEAMLDLTRAEQARDEINKLLLREDIQNALMAQGIDPMEAKARIDSLSDAEVMRIADEIDKLPAGAGGIFAGGLSIGPPVWLIVAGIAVIVLIIVGIVWLATSDGEDIEKK